AGRARLLERAVRFGKQRRTQIGLSRSARHECGEQAKQHGETSQGHRALQIYSLLYMPRGKYVKSKEPWRFHDILHRFTACSRARRPPARTRNSAVSWK